MGTIAKGSPPTRGRGVKPVRVAGSSALAPIPPGEVLSEEFLKPLGISQNALARAVEIPPARVNDLVHGRRAITADTAVRLAVFFGTSIDFWINLQAHYDARVARHELQPRLSRRIRPFAQAG
jgi:addiction module HigA family antidote